MRIISKIIGFISLICSLLLIGYGNLIMSMIPAIHYNMVFLLCVFFSISLFVIGIKNL